MNFISPPSTSLREALEVFCDEVGLPVPEPQPNGVYTLWLEDHELRISLQKNAQVILLGVIGRVDDLAARRQTSSQHLLTSCLTLHAARFSKLSGEEILSLEPETGELILWRSFAERDLSIPTFLQATEALVNELEFWKNWLTQS